MVCLLCTLCNTCPNIMIIIITVGTCQYLITTILKFSIWIISNSDQCVEIRQCRIYSKLRRPLVILWQGIAQQLMQMRSVWMCWAGVMSMQHCLQTAQCPCLCCLCWRGWWRGRCRPQCVVVPWPGHRPQPGASGVAGNEPSRSLKFHNQVSPCWKRPRHYAKWVPKQVDRYEIGLQTQIV